MRVLVINGPNLNLLGQREASIYGEVSLQSIEQMVKDRSVQLGGDVEFFQSNSEGELIDRIHAAYEQKIDGILINPGGYTHTSVALRDALLAVRIPFIEIHISNVAGREPCRHVSYFSDIALGTITGLGPYGYVLALEGLMRCSKG